MSSRTQTYCMEICPFGDAQEEQFADGVGMDQKVCPAAAATLVFSLGVEVATKNLDTLAQASLVHDRRDRVADGFLAAVDSVATDYKKQADTCATNLIATCINGVVLEDVSTVSVTDIHESFSAALQPLVDQEKSTAELAE